MATSSAHAIERLRHHAQKFGGGTGGEIVVLNTGAIIGPQEQAMLGALHSRSVGGIRHHLSVVAKRGAESFMATTYVGYGHKSVGDMGPAQVYIEGVSMLAAKAFQDYPLYAGQEASTRYIDFSKQRFIDPVGTIASRFVLEEWRRFYLEALAVLIDWLPSQFPRNEGESEAEYLKAIKARAFDITRAFLPAGASTNLLWFGSLRHFGDRLPVLRNHPLKEVRQAALAAEGALARAYPQTFLKRVPGADGELVTRRIRYEASEKYHALCQALYGYTDFDASEFALAHDGIDRELMHEYRRALNERPPKTELPFNIREAGTLRFQYLLDFGSFRDAQRQRAVIIPMPLLTTRHGFEPWYLKALPDALRERAEQVLAAQAVRIEALELDEHTRQYYLPMGYRTANRLTGDLRGLVYLIELRATRFVHPTLRHRAVQMAAVLRERFGMSGMQLHLDPEPDRFDVKRGTHDIIIGA